MNIKNEFVPYEQALALKELGFNEPCFGYYYASDKKEIRLEMYIDVKNQDVYYVSAPLYQQAFSFFREKYGLFTQDFIDLDNKFTKNIVKVLENGQDFLYLSYHNTYEEAELECLKELIEIVKNK